MHKSRTTKYLALFICAISDLDETAIGIQEKNC